LSLKSTDDHAAGVADSIRAAGSARCAGGARSARPAKGAFLPLGDVLKGTFRTLSLDPPMIFVGDLGVGG